MNLTWIHRLAHERIIDEAKKRLPNETGGCFMGYWINPFEECVITEMIGPGPKAIHRQTSFIPDSKWQEHEIAKIYEESGRVHTYLGDWHTHPNGSMHLSWRDRRTLRRIALCSEARTPVPIMGVLGGSKSFSMLLWRYEVVRFAGFPVAGAKSAMSIKIYE